MILRRQLPVHSPIAASAFAPALRAAATGAGDDRKRLAAELGAMFGSRTVVLTDSGTSALVLALRVLVGAGGTVALPGYACVDLVAAAIRAGVKVRLYDIEPSTLVPDLDSLSLVLDRGASAVVVAHLYGFPVDMRSVTDLVTARGSTVIEDAAQGAGGTLDGRPLGSFGALAVLSFGRGKGITGGGGGALLGIDREGAERIDSGALPRRATRGWRELSFAAAQWAFGRPAVYAIPSALPGLRLGEMVYHPACEPGPISDAAAALVRRALRGVEREAAIRRQNAAILMGAIAEGHGLAAIRPTPEGNPSYIRFPVRDLRHRFTVPAMGILRAYPRPLTEQPEIRECLESHQAALPGAVELARTLFTLPVHSLLSRRDLDHLQQWLRTSLVRDHRTLSVPPRSSEAMTARFIRRS